MPLNHKRKAGFTLIELMVVISIIGILSAFSLIAYSGINSKARDTRRQQDLKAIAEGLEIYANLGQANPDHLYPDQQGSSSTDCTSNNILYKDTTPNFKQYMKNLIVPKDPKNQDEGYCYFSSTDNRAYTLFAKLENCGQANCDTWNYSVTSPNAP